MWVEPIDIQPSNHPIEPSSHRTSRPNSERSKPPDVFFAEDPLMSEVLGDAGCVFFVFFGKMVLDLYDQHISAILGVHHVI